MSEVKSVNPKTGGQKNRKPEKYHHLPWEQMREIAKVFDFGSRKYERYNYRKGYDWSDSWDALIRHCEQFWMGEDLDSESGLPHMAHAGFHCLILMLFMKDHRDLDDRPHVATAKTNEEARRAKWLGSTVVVSNRRIASDGVTVLVDLFQPSSETLYTGMKAQELEYDADHLRA